MFSLHALIERAARLNPDGCALRCGSRTRDWSELRDRVARLAGGLAMLGHAEGERIALLSLNSDRYYESIFAVPWAGYCVVPLNTRWALPENNYAISDSASRVLMFDDAFAEQAPTLLQEVDCLETGIYMGDGDCPGWALSYEDVISEHKPLPPSLRAGDEMAGIFYTGGTTGSPKGVMQSHRAIWASALGTMPDFGMTRDSVYLHVAPMFHMADFCGGMGVTLSCGTNVVLPTFDPGTVLATFGQEKITHVLLVPAMVKMVLNHPDVDSADVSTLQRTMYGASPIPAATLGQCMAMWPGVGLVPAYGQTELAPVVTTLSMEAHLEGGEVLKSAGRPTAVNDVRIVDEQGADCSPGVSGEIAVRGPHLMLGYWNKPEETANALRNGWPYTGDVGYLGEGGYLYIVDPVKAMIVTGGENVFTTEVENAIISHDAVLDVAVIGIPHEEWAERCRMARAMRRDVEGCPRPSVAG